MPVFISAIRSAPRGLGLSLIALIAAACGQAPAPTTAGPAASAYFDNAGRKDVWAGGVRKIPISTAKGTFNVWTKRVGNNPAVKLLLLHGGPGATHEYFEAFDSFLPGAGVEFYYYDQLGSAFSDQPDDDSLYQLPRFVDEVEQVRVALGLDVDNFYLFGHSWGGILAIEYALKYPQHLKGLIVSNMMSSIPAYNEYAHKVLMPAMDQHVLAEILAIEKKKDFENPKYEALLMPSFYEQHLLRRPSIDWPDPVLRAFAKINKKIYVPMQGPSEMGASGRLEKWDRSQDLKSIATRTLVIGAAHDTMDPAHMEWMSKQFPNGTYLFAPNGSHMAMYDDQDVYMKGLIDFLKK